MATRSLPFARAALRHSQAAVSLFPLKDGTLLLDTGEQTSCVFEPSSAQFTELAQRGTFKPPGSPPRWMLCVSHFFTLAIPARIPVLHSSMASNLKQLAELPADIDPQDQTTAFFSRAEWHSVG